MNSLVEAIREDLGREDKYTANVAVNFYQVNKNKLIEEVTTSIPFTLDIEYRSWGIKGILYIFNDIITIPYTEEDIETETELSEDKTIQVDLSQLKQEFVAGGGFTVRELDIYLDEKDMVDYSKSTITSTYLEL
jgi:hypothetical protein